jgi:hypothetical protein
MVMDLCWQSCVMHLCFQRLPKGLALLTSLRRLSCHDNPPLVFPPLSVVEAGTEATMEYLGRALMLDCRHLCACCSRVVCQSLPSSLQPQSATGAATSGPLPAAMPHHLAPASDNCHDDELDWC